jgi:hypothetical protein
VAATDEMDPRETVIRIDATWHPTVAPGDTIICGQRVCDEPDAPTSPLAGTIHSVQFDAGNHEFLVAITPSE